MFEILRGQDDAIRQMINALHHSVNTYAFFGSRGTYVEEAARIFASHLIDASGESDQRVLNRHHVDVVEFEPVGVTYRVKEDVREAMLSELRKAPIETSHKVLIVHDAHLLRSDSANTLLKSLEEPPENVHWILIAPSKDMLLQTIQSRCFSIEFARLRPDIIEDVLVSEGVNADMAHDVSTRCAGRLDRARKLARHYWPIAACTNDIARVNDTHAASCSRNAARIVETIDEISSDVIAMNKKELDEVKKSMKDSGYSDKVAQSIVTSTKKRLEAGEKKLKSELVEEFLDSLQVSYTRTVTSDADKQMLDHAVAVSETIDQYRRRLIFNPSDTLFFESLLASISQPA